MAYDSILSAMEDVGRMLRHGVNSSPSLAGLDPMVTAFERHISEMRQRPRAMEPLPDPAPVPGDDRIPALEKRVADLETKLWATLEKPSEPAPAPAPPPVEEPPPSNDLADEPSLDDPPPAAAG